MFIIETKFLTTKLKITMQGNNYPPQSLYFKFSSEVNYEQPLFYDMD